MEFVIVDDGACGGSTAASAATFMAMIRPPAKE